MNGPRKWALILQALPCALCVVGSPVEAREGLEADELVYERTYGGNQDLYVQAAGGGPERRLTDDPAVDALPRWSRDGTRVIFSSKRTGEWQLYEVGAEGGRARRLRTNQAIEYQADESPDGRWLAFLSNLEGAEWLWLWAKGPEAARAVVKHGRRSVLGNPHWSPDGKRIVFSSNWRVGHHIYLLDVATGKESRMSPLLKGGCEPRFSPDGKKIVYVSRGHLAEKSRLVEYDPATDKERVIVDWPGLNYDPVYSPDGSELAFASNITGDWVVYRQRIADGKSWRVTHGEGAARYPDYRPRPPS
jgi:Tol biopolymer transport system component